MPINFFTTINSVLDQAISDICRVQRISEANALERARQFLVDTSAQYYSEDPHVAYEDPLCRWAYLYTYVGAHANLLDNALCNLDPLQNFLLSKIHSSQSLSICSLGGGPGSELLGFVKFIERTKNPGDCINLQFSLIDRVPQWDDSWHALVNGLENTFKSNYGASRQNWPIIINHSFLPLDMLDVNCFGGFLSRFGSTELFVLNHVVSELLAHPNEFQTVFNTIVNLAPDNAFILIIDRNQGDVVTLCNRLIDENGEVIKVAEYSESRSMDPDEQKQNLGKWYQQMNHNPKLKWRAYYYLAQKIIF